MKTKLVFLFAILFTFLTFGATNDVDMTALTLDMLAKANAVSAPVNPYAGPIAALLGVLGMLWGVFGQFRKVKAEKHLAVVVQGVEFVGDKATKKAVAEAAIKAGVSAAVDTAVQKILR